MAKPLIVTILIISFAFISANLIEVKKPETKEQLGEKLFFDPILSKDYSISCASCHKPEFAFADNIAFSFGVDSAFTLRNTPSVMNVSAFSSFFWDGRAKTLEEQALMPIEHPGEMDLPIEEALQRLNSHKEYQKLFKKIFKSPATKENLGKAMAAFQLTLETGKTPFDRWMDGDDNAMSAAAINGRKIFHEKAKCFDCHFGPDFTGDEVKNIGLFDGQDFNDKGRFVITNDSSDLGKFKTSGLRNIALTAPYMHNGMF
ncbi:MAG: cytochrome-c peroxidase, partial [Bacteroidetes bacterium]|nr:cytochrome-c peroxidase [Bacteroidota bacterium]